MILNFDTSEKEAARTIGIAPDTLKRDRLDGKIPSYVYTKFGYKRIRYCLPLLRDWQLDPDDLQAQARAMQLIEDSRPSNVPRKSGRKAT